MAYLRILSPYIPLAQKHLIVQQLIEVTSRAFQIRAEDISIQFILLPLIGSVTGFGPAIPRNANFFLEVNHNRLTEEKKRALTEEIKSMLTQVLGAKRGTWFTRLLRITPSISRQVALLFNEVIREESTSRRETFRDLERRAA